MYTQKLFKQFIRPAKVFPREAARVIHVKGLMQFVVYHCLLYGSNHLFAHRRIHQPAHDKGHGPYILFGCMGRTDSLGSLPSVEVWVIC